MVKTSAARSVTALVTVGTMALGLAACSSDSEPSPTPSPTATSASPTPTPTPSPSAVPLPAKPVIAVKIENTRAAYPRVGHAGADVIYVEPVEAGLTRLLAMFISTKPEKVGPVRSARESDVALIAAYGSGIPFVFSGASAYTNRILARGPQKNLPHGSVGGYWREPGRAAPHNLMANLKTLMQKAGKPVIAKDTGLHFGEAPTGGKAATSILASWPSAKVGAAYSASRGYALTLDGSKEIDAGTGKALSPRTIIVQHVIQKASGNRDVLGNVTPTEVLIGTGKATFFRDGKVWTGTWTRKSQAGPTAYRIGTQEFLAAEGQVWVLLLPNGRPLTVK